MKEVTLQATSEDESESETICLAFDDSDLDSLQLYLDNCTRLEAAQIFKKKFPDVSNIKLTAEEGMAFEVSEFEYSHVCELLHLARPIFLSKEPASFKKTQAIFGKRAKNTALAKHLKLLRNTYERGDYQPYFQITIGDTPLFHDETVKLWLNGVEYHQDSEKAAIVKELEKSLSESTARGIFISQLSGRIRATFMLAHLAKLVIDKNER